MKAQQPKPIKYINDNNGSKIYEAMNQEPIFRDFWATMYEEKRTVEEINKARETMEMVSLNLNEQAITPNNNICYEDIQDIAITTEELVHTLKTFQQKAPGWDGITKTHLIKAIDFIKDPLTRCFNASLSCGYFPNLYKQTKLIFIPKPDKDPTNVANYRPISLLSTTGKLLEKLLNRRLINHLEEQHQFNDHQHGFRKKRGTETALAMIWESIAKGLQHNLKVLLTSRDIKKAFDRVWQRGLKFKLMQLNLHPRLLTILSHYLDYRTASIQLNGHRGPNFPIECGVPQGGCLSTTLFNIYTRDLPEKIYPWTNNTFYADDITQIVRDSNYNRTQHVWSSETNNTNKFENNWLIKTNLRKFKLLNLGGFKERTFQNQRY